MIIMESNDTVKLENPQIQDTQSILNAFKQKFSTTVRKVRVNSLNREVAFREVTTKEQKTLSKTTIENEQRKDIVYDAQCQLINTLALEDGFDIYGLTEFDRIKLLLAIYQNNYFQNDISYKCQECGMTNVYKLDFQKIINKLDAIDFEDDVFTTEFNGHILKFVINYPTVKNVSLFYRDYMKKYKGLSTVERQVLDNLGTVEYINLFIKRIEMINPKDPMDVLSIDLTLMTYSEIEKFIDQFPQDIILSEHGGVINYIMTNFVKKVDSAFEYEKCNNCGAKTTEGVGSLLDFF
jgi:hypothetical protein